MLCTGQKLPALPGVPPAPAPSHACVSLAPALCSLARTRLASTQLLRAVPSPGSVPRPAGEAQRGVAPALRLQPGL